MGQRCDRNTFRWKCLRDSGDSGGRRFESASSRVEDIPAQNISPTGDEAKTAAKDLVKERAYITADNLNIRETPSTWTETSLEKCLQGSFTNFSGDRWLV